MSAFENAKTMSSEELMNKIAALNLPEYGLCEGTLLDRLELAGTECKEDGKEPGIAAALNNADVDKVLLEVFRKDPEKVAEGIAVAALAFETERKILYLPEEETGLAEESGVKAAAEKYGVEIRLGILDKRACKGCALIHIVTAAELVDALEGTYEPGVYVSVNGGSLEKYPESTAVSDIADLSGAKIVQAGYRYITPQEAAELTVGEAGIHNGILRVLGNSECTVAETEKRLLACRKQSCGKCVFCREGLLQLQFMHKEITDGKGKQDYIGLTKEIGEAMTFSTPCTMGQFSSVIALSAVDLASSEYEAHIKKKKCPAEVCFSSETIYIDPQTCEGCGECMDVCPKDCIEGKAKYIHMIDDIECDKCGKCIEACEAGAIIRTSGKVPKLPNRLTKVGRFKKR